MWSTLAAQLEHAVFISLASKDLEGARKNCEALRAAGTEVFWDQNELLR